MEKQMEYRIYTEAKDAVTRSLVVKTVSKYFPAFTINSALGYWDGQRENSLQITIVTNRSRAKRKTIERLAIQIRDVNQQICVMITATKIKGKLI